MKRFLLASRVHRYISKQPFSFKSLLESTQIIWQQQCKMCELRLHVAVVVELYIRLKAAPQGVAPVFHGDNGGLLERCT